MDTAPPLTAFRLDPVPTSYGWNNFPVTVTLEAEDDKSGPAQVCYALSGVITQEARSVAGASTAFDLEDEGITTIYYYAIDGWENQETAKEDAVRIDKRSPSISGSRSPRANEHGWNNEDIRVTFHCSDPLSGIAGCTGDRTVSSEKKGQSVTGHATDKAGNTRSYTVGNINIDKTRPKISTGNPQGTMGNNDWYRSDVTVPFTATDKLSGFTNGKLTTEGSARTSGEGTDRTALIRVSDLADNVAEKTVGPFKVDKTKPTITATLKPRPNSNGWNNEDVEVRFECRDAVSEVASCTGDQTVTREGRDQPVTGEAVDRAGNRNTKTVKLNIDKTEPNVSVRLSSSSIEQGDSITISITASDELSGIDSVRASDSNLGSISLSHSGDRWEGTISPSISGRVTVTAKDKAGNTDTDSESYTVIIPQPPYFRVSGLSVSPSSPFPVDTTATISATVKNTGESSGSQYIRLLIDGSEKDSKWISLSAGESTTVRFYYTFRYSGNYTVKVESEDAYKTRTVTVIRENHPPRITDVDVVKVIPGHPGFARINVSIDFRDEDGDVEYVLWKYADDSDYRRIDVGDQASGKTSGTIKLENLPCASDKIIYLRLRDKEGLESNRESIDCSDYC